MSVPVLTKRQAEVLAAIDHLTLTAGYPPTYREMGKYLGVNYNAVVSVKKCLIVKGFLSDNRSQARTFTITKRTDGNRVLFAGAWYIWEPCAGLVVD